MHQGTRLLTLALLAILLTAVRASAEQKIAFAQMSNGLVSADKNIASEGQTVVLTVVPAEGYLLQYGSLLVEKIVGSDEGDYAGHTPARRKTPGIGDFVSLKQTTPNTYEFQMPATDVEIRAAFIDVENCLELSIEATESSDATLAIEGVTLMAYRYGKDNTVVIEQINVPNDIGINDIAVYIPRTVTDKDGNTYDVTSVSPYAIYGQTNISDIFLPDTDNPLVIAENAFRLDDKTGDAHQIATIHTPLALLDDYALMLSLAEHYATSHIRATARTFHRYWTFSCGVDVKLPGNIRTYICHRVEGNRAEIIQMDGQELLADGQMVNVVKANNGILIGTDDEEGGAYEVIACPSEDRPSGMLPSTVNAHTYKDNLLEPVIQQCHYDGIDGCYVLSGNQFYKILQETSDVCVPACKAIIHLEKTKTRSLGISTDKTN